MYTCVCKHCKRIFKAPMRTACCNECRQFEKEPFDDIKNYLEEFPNSNAMQIAMALEIPVSIILQYIDEGYLWPVKGSFEKLPEK
ncbi:MAG: hypothetical protein ACERKN_05430 [Velocimicrobium sp.]